MNFARILGLVLLAGLALADVKRRHKEREWRHTTVDDGSKKFVLPDDLDFDFDFESEFKNADFSHKKSGPLLQNSEEYKKTDDSKYLPESMQVKEIEVKNVKNCDPDIISMYFTVPLPHHYSPFEWNNEVEHICPNLVHTCCESHELLERRKEFQANYLAFTGYRFFELFIQSVPPNKKKSAKEIEILLRDMHLAIESKELSLAEAIDAFLSYFRAKKTNIMELIRRIGQYEIGFMCEFCRPKSAQFFMMAEGTEGAQENILEIQEEPPIVYVEAANEYFKIEQAYSEAYKILLQSKEFRDMFPADQLLTFESHEDFVMVEKTMKECLENHKSRFEVYRRPPCVYYIERLGWNGKVTAFGWIKRFHEQIYPLLIKNMIIKDEWKQHLEKLPDDIEFWKANDSKLKIQSFVRRFNISLGLSMTENQMKFDEWDHVLLLGIGIFRVGIAVFLAFLTAF